METSGRPMGRLGCTLGAQGVLRGVLSLLCMGFVEMGRTQTDQRVGKWRAQSVLCPFPSALRCGVGGLRLSRWGGWGCYARLLLMHMLTLL